MGGRTAAVHMSTTGKGILEIVLGFALIGYAAFGVVNGSIVGKWRVYTRRDNPVLFWATAAIAVLIGLACFYRAALVFGGSA